LLSKITPKAAEYKPKIWRRFTLTPWQENLIFPVFHVYLLQGFSILQPCKSKDLHYFALVGMRLTLEYKGVEQMTIIIAITLFLAVVILFGLVMKKIRAAGTTVPEATQAPPPPSETPEQEFTQILDVLLKLNLMIRQDLDFSEQMIVKVETIIDDLKAITPAMMERYPGESLTYEIKKIGLSHLYKTVKEFLDLSGESREKQLDNFKTTIQSLQDVTHRSRDIIESNETAEFKTMAHFLAGKFS
jgi:hypothetical protein